MADKEPITSSPRRIKQSGYWCEDADNQTERLLKFTGLTWDSEIPIVLTLHPDSTLGISNAIQALGICRPKFRTRANKILNTYANMLFDKYCGFSERMRVAIPVRANIVTDDNRLSARSEQRKRYVAMLYDAEHPARRGFLQGLVILFGPDPLFMRCLHGTKELLGAVWALEGEESAAKLNDEIKAFLKQEIENG